MNCHSVRDRLSASERPDEPDEPSAAHLAGCAGCRGWLRRLVKLEAAMPLAGPAAPAPPPELLAFFRETALIRPTLHAPKGGRREGARRKLALACSLAASLSLFAVGLWAWPKPVPGAALPQAVRVAKGDEARVGAAADWALESVRDLRKRPSSVAEVEARMAWLLRDQLPRFARGVSAARREAVLGPAALRLRETESEAMALAAEWAGRDEAVVLRRIAETAREAQEALRQLARA